MEVIVYENGQGKFTQNIIVGEHTLISDEPSDSGGENFGPSPYDLLLAALGSCTSMTLRMYADLKKIKLAKVLVRLKYEKIHATDCVGCENESAKMDHIERIIELQGELSQAEKNKLIEIANKCPVHRTLTSKIIIDTYLKDEKKSSSFV